MNKKQYLNIITILIFLVTDVYSQTVIPPHIDFIGLKENWVYISKDTNFIKSPEDKWSTPYWGRFPTEIISTDEQLFILENCQAQSPYGVTDGSLLHAIDWRSGKLEWIYHNNSYVGNIFREDYLNSRLHINNNSEIEMMGYRCIDTLDKNKAAFGFYANPIRKYIDIKTGKKKSENVGDDLTKNFYNATGLGGTRIIRNRRNDFFHTGVYPFIVNDTSVVIEFKMFGISEDYKIQSKSTFDYKYGSKLGNKSPSMTYWYWQINQDTVILLFSENNLDDLENSPVQTKLVWLDISDGSNVKVQKELDITKDINSPQDLESQIILNCKDDHIVVYQYSKSTSSVGNNDFSTTLLWYDKTGNKLAKLASFKNENENENYKNIGIIGVKDNSLYIAAYKNNKEIMGIDVLKIEKNSSSPLKLGSIIANKNSRFEIGFSNFHFFPNDDLLVAVRLNYKTIENIETSLLYYYSFKLEDIISNSKDYAQANENIDIFPNPTNSELHIVSDKIVDEVRIFNSAGILVRKYLYSSNLDISFLENGMYFIEAKVGSVINRKRIVKI